MPEAVFASVEEFPYVYVWRDLRPCRHGQHLKITNRGMDHCGVEFEDSTRMIVPRLSFKLGRVARGKPKAAVFGYQGGVHA